MTDKKEEPFSKEDSKEEEYWESLDVNDCGYLLRALEREAFTSVVNALRAKGPPSEHTFLLLDHLKSALSINDELGRAEIRRAAFDPKLCKLSNVLNPNYDTCTEWSGCSVESRGFVEAGPSRGKPFAKTSSHSIADQLLRQATTRNEKINRSTGRAVELLALPHKPYVPERLRVLLRETDRAEERVAPPLEMVSSPPILVSVDRESREEGRPPPAKKRRPRLSKGKKEKPPELKPENSPKKEEEEAACVDTPSTSAAVAPPETPLADSASANSSAAVGSAGTVIISPGQPPQSGDAMKTWVSKIHEEVAASAAKKNGGVVDAVEACEPSTSVSSTDESAKKKRRSRAPVQDTYYLNSCARTRPFQFEKEDKASGKPKPARGNPDMRMSCKRPAPGIFGVAGTASGQSGIPPATPIARIAATETVLGYGSRNGLLDDSSSSVAASASTSSSIPGSLGVKPSTPVCTQVKQGQGTPNSARAQGRYYVNNSGVAVFGSSNSPSAVKSLSTTGGIGGRTGSLGSQQLTSLHGMMSGMPLITHKATASNSSSSISSTGGASTSSGIGASMSSSSETLNADSFHPVSAPPPEVAGHDYTSPPVAAGPSSTPAKVVPRVPRLTNPTLPHSPIHTSNLPNGLVPLIPTPSTTPVPTLQRTASMSTFRPRLGSRGAASAAGVAPTGERLGPIINEPVTDGMVQATVHNIMLEAAQKECANGKRATVLMRENGILNRNSPVPGPSSQPVQQFQPYAVCRSTTSDGGAGTSSSSSMTRQQPVQPSFNKTTILAALTATPSAPAVSIGYIPTPSHLPSSSLSTLPSFTTSPSIGGGMGPSLFGGPSTSTSLPSFLNINPFIPPVNVSQEEMEKAKMRHFLLTTPQGNISNIFQNAMAKATIIPNPVPQQQPQQPPPPAATSPAVPPPVASLAVPPRPGPRQFLLQPEGMSYTEFNVDNPSSFKAFAPDGTPVQYVVQPEELYDQGLISRPSTSGIGGGGRGGGSGETSRTHQPQASSHSSLLQESNQIAAIAAAQLGIPSSFSIPSTSGTGGGSGEMPSGSGEQPGNHQPPQPITGALPPREDNASSEVKDILAQSCMELQ